MDDCLQELLSLIRGEGKFAITGKGLHGYPFRDSNNTRIFNECRKLEELGLIYRKIDLPGYVLFAPIEDK